MKQAQDEPQEHADPGWFRPPTRREHAIGTALFLGFAVFFVLLFLVLRGSGFRWLMLGLGIFSLLRGLWHLPPALRRTPAGPTMDHPQELEIDTARGRRWLGWAGYLLLYGAVAAILVALFVKLSTPLLGAVGIVVFMVGYMALMGYLAGRNVDRKE